MQRQRFKDSTLLPQDGNCLANFVRFVIDIRIIEIVWGIQTGGNHRKHRVIVRSRSKQVYFGGGLPNGGHK